MKKLTIPLNEIKSLVDRSSIDAGMIFKELISDLLEQTEPLYQRSVFMDDIPRSPKIISEIKKLKEISAKEQNTKTEKVSRLSTTEKKKRKADRNDIRMVRIGKWFKRKSDTLWNLHEEESLNLIDPSDSEINQMEIFYIANIPKEADYRRKTILTLLNNWDSELDKAREFNEKDRSNTGVSYSNRYESEKSWE